MKKYNLLLMLVLFSPLCVWAQDGFKSVMNAADKAYQQHEYSKAKSLYEKAFDMAAKANNPKDKNAANAGIQKCKPSLTIDGQNNDLTMTVGPGANTCTFQINTQNVKTWTVFSNKEFLKVQKKGNNAISVSWDENPSNSQREGFIYIATVGGVKQLEKNIKITQQIQPAFSLDKEYLKKRLEESAAHRKIHQLIDKAPSEALDLFKDSVMDDEFLAFEYAEYLLDGTLGKKDTLEALFLLAHLASDGAIIRPYSYPITLKREPPYNTLFGDSLVIYAAKRVLNSLSQTISSNYLSNFLVAQGIVKSSEGNFFEAEKTLKQAVDEMRKGNGVYDYCYSNPELVLSYFYLCLDNDIDDGGFESMYVVNKEALAQYNKQKGKRGKTDNASYWLWQFHEHDIDRFNAMEITAMSYPLPLVLGTLYRYGGKYDAKNKERLELLKSEMKKNGLEKWLDLLE